ncbi:FAD-binding oxidoreductase [Lacibacterium aquatile]|uniref:FAD-binding oxidoreductase n=1 Tax=Lacibacterium aquatile TaxID=1168082 RepID=A0ABW5DMU7_9PROT
MIDSAFIARLTELLGPKGVLTDTNDLEPHLKEWRGLYRGGARVVAKPASTAEVSAVLKLCNDAGVPVVPQGGNTGLVGGAVAPEGSLILALGRMNRIRAIDPVAHTMTVDAGCILADIQTAAEAHDRLFPLSLAAEGTCQIGGNISTNAGGTAVLRYGNTRDLVLGVEVVLPDGQTLEGLRPLRKDNTGYDLKNLFIGAEGTLGIITGAVLKLYPRPRDVATAFVAVPDAQASVDLLSLARGQSGDTVTTFELMNRLSVEMVFRHVPGCSDPLSEVSPWYVLIELSSPRDGGGLTAALEEILGGAMESGLVTDAAIAQNEAQGAALWRLREEISDAQKFEGGSIKHDISVAIADVPAFMTEATEAVLALMPGIRPVSFGHVGDGNIHFNLSQPTEMDKQVFLDRWAEVAHEVHEIVHRFGGSFSAEHGIGQLKVGDLEYYKSPVELEIMRRVKRALDPKNLLNPGKVVIP